MSEHVLNELGTGKGTGIRYTAVVKFMAVDG